MAEKIDVAKLVATYEARTSQYERALKRIEGKNAKTTRRMSKQFTKLNGSIATAASTLRLFAGAFGGGLALGGLTSIPSALRGITAEAAGIAETADKVGLTTERLQELRFAAEQDGVAVNTLDMAMQRFSRRVGEAANGTGELRDTLKKLGIAVRDVNGNIRSQDAILNNLADAIQNTENEQERLAIAFKAFDSEGAALVNTLRNGSEGLREFARQARDADAVLSDELIRSAKEVDSQFAKLSATISTKLKRGVLQALDTIKLYAQFASGPASLSTDLLKDRVEALTKQYRDLAAAGEQAAAASVLARIEADKAELSRRASDQRKFGAGPANPQGGFTIRGPVRPRQRPDTEAFHNAVMRQQERESAARKRVADAAQRQREQVTRVTEALRFETEQFGLSNAQQRINRELRSAGISASDPRAVEIERLVRQIDAKENALKKVETQTARIKDAASQASDAIGEIFETISSGAKLSTQDVAQLVFQFIRLGQIASQNGGSFSGNGGDIFGSLFGGSPVFR